ncbi:MAG: hypothetical protein ABUL42_03800 [Terricaulis silvestris]
MNVADQSDRPNPRANSPHMNRIDLWRFLRSTLSQMRIALGGPNLIASTRLTPRSRREILDWLAPLERLVRKLLLIEAARLPLPAMREKQTQTYTPARIAAYVASVGAHEPRPLQRTRPVPQFALVIPPDPLDRKPKTEASLARIRRLGPPLLVRDICRDNIAAAESAARAQRLAQRDFGSAHRLAERYEALARAIEDPAPHIARMAKKLWSYRGAAAHKARLIAEARPVRRARAFDNADWTLITQAAVNIIPAFSWITPLTVCDTS